MKKFTNKHFPRKLWTVTATTLFPTIPNNMATVVSKFQSIFIYLFIFVFHLLSNACDVFFFFFFFSIFHYNYDVSRWACSRRQISHVVWFRKCILVFLCFNTILAFAFIVSFVILFIGVRWSASGELFRSGIKSQHVG